MLQLKNSLVALLGLCLIAMQANAVEDFYSGTVPVNDRSQVSFRAGMNEALLQVLVKASAETPERIRQNPNLQGELKNAERFAAQFLYKTQADVLADGSTKNQVYLQASFPEKIIMGLLKQGGVRFWSARRETVLVLPVVNQGDLALMATSREPAIMAQLDKAGQKYGIPLQIAGDGQETAERVWDMDMAYLQQLLADSHKKFALVVKIAGDNAGGRGQWLLVDGIQTAAVEVNVDGAANFADKGMAWVASQLANKGAVELGSAATGIELSIDKVDSYPKYEAALSYLESISIVEQVQIVKAHRGNISLTLKLTTGVDQLEKIFAADHKISITANEDGQKSYHWNE